MSSAESIYHIRDVVEIYRSYLQADIFERSAPKASKYYALYAKDIADSWIKRGKPEIAALFIKAALYCDNSDEEVQANKKC
jgi:hypothetical protein